MDIDRVKHLLACLGEECGEVQQIVGKSLRFGIYDVNPKTNVSNIENLKLELFDIISVVEMLEREINGHLLPIHFCQEDEDILGAKKDKVLKYMKRKEIWEKI